MIFKEWIRFVYGMAMGTSVPYIKPTNRFMWPTALKTIDDHMSLFLGGSVVCGILHDKNQVVLINTNSGPAASQLHQYIEKKFKATTPTLFNTTASKDFFDGNKLYPSANQIYLPNVSDQALHHEWQNSPATVTKMVNERTFEIAGETLVVVPILESASHCDLAIYLKSRKILFLGGLFYNRIHPFLRPLDGMNVANWIRNLDALMGRFQPETIIPAEGDLAGPAELKEFVDYLKALSNPKIEFSDCRKTYDWLEIPGQTSLEENFDLLRENIKSFTKF